MTPIRFYISARFGRQAEARATAEEITERTGWECTARWLDADPSVDDAVHSDRARMMGAATLDLIDIDAADVMFCLTETTALGFDVPASLARGGRHVEVGYAIAREKPILVIGPRENLFHGMASVHDTVEDAARLAMRIIDARHLTGDGKR